MEQANCLEKQWLYLQESWIFSNAIESAGFNDMHYGQFYHISACGRSHEI